MSDEPVETSLSEERQASPARPGSVTWLIIGVLTITVLGFLRGYLAIRGWEFLASWPGVSPLYLVVSGLLVGFLGGAVVWALVTKKHWALRFTEAVVLTFALAYWLDQIFVADHPYDDPAGVARAFLPVNWLFAAGVTIFIMIYIGLVVRSTRVKAYFGDENE